MIFDQWLIRILAIRILFIILTVSSVAGVVAGCTLSGESAPDTPSEPAASTAESTVVVLPDLSPNPDSALWTDENEVMSGICFESANDAADQSFVIRNEAELSRFFDLSDNSQLCGYPVQRHAFDFSGGRVLAGIWTQGQGCVAYHHLLEFNRDEAAQTLVIRLRLVVEGTCNYELVRPFWIGLEGVANYTITIEVE